MLEAEQKRIEDSIKQVEEKFNKERKEMENALESKLKEQDALLNKGFKEKAELLEKEIENLKKQLEERSNFKESVMPLVNILASDVLPAVLQYRVTMKKLTP